VIIHVFLKFSNRQFLQRIFLARVQFSSK
jgi:hypothetical protein